MSFKTVYLPIIMTNMNRAWESVLRLGTPEHFPKGGVVAGSDADVDGIFYITRGLARLSCMTRTGKEYAMLYMAEGMLCNENDVFHKGLNHFLTSIEPLDAVFFPHSMFNERFFAQHPDLSLNLIRSLSQKSRILYAMLGNTRLLDSFDIVCLALYRMHLFNRVGGEKDSAGQPGRIVPRLSQQELASFLGMHRASMHAALHRLREEGVIAHYSRKELLILDLAALEVYVHATE